MRIIFQGSSYDNLPAGAASWADSVMPHVVEIDASEEDPAVLAQKIEDYWWVVDIGDERFLDENINQEEWRHVCRMKLTERIELFRKRRISMETP